MLYDSWSYDSKCLLVKMKAFALKHLLAKQVNFPGILIDNLGTVCFWKGH